jgi:predicted amino acid racemase
MWNNEKRLSCSPRLEIDLGKIEINIRKIIEIYSSGGIAITGVTKGVCGDPDIAALMVECGIRCLGDSRIENIEKMRTAGVQARFMLLRSPFLSRIEDVVRYADISLNSELSVIRALSSQAGQTGHIHEIILMVELGDLREGIMPCDLDQTVDEISKLKNIRLIGLGTNLACLAGVIPDRDKMDRLSSLAESIEKKFGLTLEMVSGGNSANYDWFVSTKDLGRINNLRVGESILLGCETLHRKPIPGLYADAFVLYAEVIEAKIKPSCPTGARAQNVLGESPSIEDRGPMKRALLGVGLQDVFVSGLIPGNRMEVVGATSDHVILNSGENDLKPGQEVAFGLNYIALCTAMASPYVKKVKNR